MPDFYSEIKIRRDNEVSFRKGGGSIHIYICVCVCVCVGLQNCV
jgi:hypothetical protein